jgi:N,N'-diacetylchitobiose phosphorylase
MKYGHFDDTAREYVVTDPETPRSWINYLGEGEYCAILSHNGGGYSFHRSPQMRRLTRLRFNSLPAERPGRYFYLRERDGRFWSVSSQPAPRADAHYTTRIGLGYNVYEMAADDIRTSTSIFVPLGEALEVAHVVIENRTDRTRELDIFSYVEFAFWSNMQDLINFQYILYTCRMGFADDIVDYSIVFAEGDGPKAFSTTSLPVESFDTDREVFMGGYHTESDPGAVIAGRCADSLAVGGNPISALHSRITLLPRGTVSAVFLLGVGDAKREGRELKARCCSVAYVEEERAKLARYWDAKLAALQIDVPEENTKRNVNVWNCYQCHTTFNWSRSASFIEAGGRDGIGYRDTFQDMLAVMHTSPERTREKILTMMRGQAQEGYVTHHFQPLTLKQGADSLPSRRSIFSDDHLWMPLVVPAYVKETGDVAVLDEAAPYLDEGEGTVMEHLVKTLRFSHTAKGRHGLSLVMAADWNDCMSVKWGGESVWTSFLYYRALSDMIELARFIDRSDIAAECESMRRELQQALDEHAWDGGHFLRAFDHEGGKIGSRESDEGQIFLNAQSWAVFSGYASRERGAEAMDRVGERLSTRHGVKLLTPAYSRYRENIGAVTTFPKGLKENGGIFTHANTWAVIAEAMLGRGDRAFEYYRSYLPMNRNDDADRYEVEPYVYSQFTASDESLKFGAGRNAWLTGTAAWSYVAMTQYVLGVRPEYAGLRIAPVIPAAWDGFTMDRLLRGSRCHIDVRRTGVPGITLNGEAVEGDVVPYERLATDRLNEISVTI